MRGVIWRRPRRMAAVGAALVLVAGTGLSASAAGGGASGAPQAAASRPGWDLPRGIANLRHAILDIQATYGARYSRGGEFLKRLAAVEAGVEMPAAEREAAFRRVQSEALLAHPALDGLKLLVVKRKAQVPSKKQKGWWSKSAGIEIAMPSNHECNSSLAKDGHDNEIAVLSKVGPDSALATLHRPPDGGYAGEIDLHWDGMRFLFTRSDPENWKIFEMGTDGSGLRQVSKMPADVDCMDPCYLPDGRIIFGSTASYQSVPCWHGLKWVSNLYVMNADGGGARQLCFDQDHDLHPVVLPNGQVMYSRWEYAGICHIYERLLMVMNPDGTGQRAVYGSNSWYPNSLYFPRALPGTAGKLVSILSGYHGPHRMGQLVVLDTGRGWHEAAGIVQRISGRGDPINPLVRDELVANDWPRFLNPFPLDSKFFLVACQEAAGRDWGIYVADAFDNLVAARIEPGWALIEPVPVRAAPVPPVLPERVDPARDDALVYVHDVYNGAGLAGVPRGAVKRLRVVAYDFGYRGLAGPDKVGRGGPWEVMRILGTVPVEEDGSVFFRAPARTALTLQPLDAEGKAVQLMRSWFSAQPGESVSCVGCHETPRDTAPPRLAAAARARPRELTPWHGPARGFDFAREVQPVLDRHCVSCHDGSKPELPDLRREEDLADYRGLPVSKMETERLLPEIREANGGVFRYTPAYQALLGLVRRVGIEDDVSMLVPGEFHADTSPLIQMLKKGHQGVCLESEDWDRLVTWIDLNAPCHGTWGEVWPIPRNAHERRMELRAACGGPREDPEVVPAQAPEAAQPLKPGALAKGEPVRPAGWPFGADEARLRQAAGGPCERTIDLGEGVEMKLVRIPPGEFAMGDARGEPNERPQAAVRITRPFWMGATEVSNAQFRRFDPAHDPRYFAKRHVSEDDQGRPLNEPDQPAVRVSWEHAMAFCRWLGGKIGQVATLPTEAQWEYACRAGTDTPLWFGDAASDFSPCANVADGMFRDGFRPARPTITGGLQHIALDGAAAVNTPLDDGFVVTAPVGGRRANAWGLHDMHGNAAEWTLSEYRPYPYRDEDGPNETGPGGRRVVRGGSFFDPPKRCGSSLRLDYPAWQRVFNVGFRVIVRDEDTAVAAR